MRPDATTKRRLLLALLSAVLLSLCFPPKDWCPLAWVALVPLFLALRRASLRQALATGYLFGAVQGGAIIYYVGVFGVGPVIALALFQGLYFLATAFVIWWGTHSRRIAARTWLPPAAWVGTEYLRSLGPLGHTLGCLGYSQHTLLPAVQLASIGGLYLVSGLVALANSALAEGIADFTESLSTPRRSTLYPPLGAAEICLFAVLFGWALLLIPIRGGQRHSLTAAAIQPNPTLAVGWETLPAARQSEADHERLTMAAADYRPQLIVWPETGLAGSLPQDPASLQTVMRSAAASHAYLVVGSTELDAEGRFNTAWLVSSGGALLARYDKQHLAIFGEYLPLRKYLDFLIGYYPIRPFDYTPGIRTQLFEGNGFKAGVLICFEAMFPDLSRAWAKRGCNLLIIMTNDGWFGRTAAAAQMQNLAVLRAAEIGVPLVRAAKTGISSVIDARGKVLSRTQLFVEGMAVGRVQIVSHPLTMYARIGDWPVWISGLVIAVCLLVPRRRLGG